MQITRGIFQTLATILMGVIAYVWFFIEESERPIPIFILVSLLVLLSLEYVREGFAQKKSEASTISRKTLHKTFKNQILPISFFDQTRFTPWS